MRNNILLKILCPHIYNSFQHNNHIQITKEIYLYVKEYKKQLLQNITQLFNDLEIRFVLSDGMLLEYFRKKPIYQDDDVDIRFFSEDLDKWIQYISNPENSNNPKYNLFIHSVVRDNNWYQAKLIHFISDIPEINMDIHIDIVINTLEDNVWKYCDIDFNDIRKTIIYDIETYIPNEEDTINILKKIYGEDYMIPIRRYNFDF